MTLKVLITGATGFVGRQVLRDLCGQDCQVYALSRSNTTALPDSVNVIQIESIESYKGESLPSSIDCIIHLVAKAHVTESEADRHEYTQVNVEGTRAMLRVAQAKQVKHFIYMSSIKAAGDFPAHSVLKETNVSHPQGVYGETKWQAEQLLGELSSYGVRVSIIRPPLVYGLGVKANMAALVKLVKYLSVLPFGSIENRRSIVSVRNLSHFVMTLLFAKPNYDYHRELFIVSDPHSLSTAQICQFIAQGLAKRVWMMKLSASWLARLTDIIGVGNAWRKLTGNAEVQGVHPFKYFNWQAPYQSADEIIRMVRGIR